MKNRAPKYFWQSLTLFSLIGQIAWVVENMYLNVFIYKSFGASPSDISLMVSASAVIATVTTVFVGALSDKRGKRKIFISLGYIFWGVSILSFALLRRDLLISVFGDLATAVSAGIFLTIAIDCIMTFFGSSANDAAFNAWLTESCDDSNRGTAEGINAMMPLVAVLLVFGGFMFLNLDRPSSWTIIFLSIGGVVIISGLLGLFMIEERKKVTADSSSYLETVLYGFKWSVIKSNATLYLTLFAFIVFNISIQIFMPYLIIYYEVFLGMSDYVLIMAPAIIIAAAVTFFSGKLYDKKGFTLTSVISFVSLLVGYTVLYFTRTALPVFIGSLFMMSGYLSGMAVFGAKIRDNIPRGKEGRLQGVRIFSQVLVPGVIGPYIGRCVLSDAKVLVGNDGTSSFVPDNGIFLAAAVVAVIAIPFTILVLKSVKPRTVDLTTDFEKNLTDTPYEEYPRPMMKRDSYLSLNGKWTFDVERRGKSVYSGEILVPFVPESRISGVNIKISEKDTLIYERRFSLNNSFMNDVILLHVGASDQYTKVFVNGTLIGNNIGGYLPFTLDITNSVYEGENVVRIEVTDPLDTELPYGKQTKKRGGMWYTKVSGIWQSVWIESVCENYIKDIKITPDLNGVDLEVEGGIEEKNITFMGRRYSFFGSTFRLDVESPVLWTPEEPYLYEFTLSSGKDTVSSYFGLRTFSVIESDGVSLLALNGKPYFCHGLLDQGYYSDGVFLPATSEGFVFDILEMKKCGFNMLRKHIKLEPELFYYYCDKYGMLVFQDMINSGKYSFLLDTALPTLFLKKGIEHCATKKRRTEFEKTSFGIIKALYNHPSVVYYTIFNEGWGQFSADEFYEKFKKIDSTRIYDTTSGWFKSKLSDVESEHVYFKKVSLKSKKGRPLVLSEFGGYSCKIKEHSFNLDKTYGYRFFDNQKDFENALIRLYDVEISEAVKAGLSAAVLTQVSDIEDETNGLLTYDRKVLKVDSKRVSKMSDKLIDAFNSKYLS